MTIDLITATAVTFRPYAGETFTVDSVAGPLVLTLDNLKICKGSTIRDNHIAIGGVVYPPRKAFALPQAVKPPVICAALPDDAAARSGKAIW